MASTYAFAIVAIALTLLIGAAVVFHLFMEFMDDQVSTDLPETHPYGQFYGGVQLIEEELRALLSKPDGYVMVGDQPAIEFIQPEGNMPSTYAQRLATELRNRYEDHDNIGFQAALDRMVKALDGYDEARKIPNLGTPPPPLCETSIPIVCGRNLQPCECHNPHEASQCMFRAVEVKLPPGMTADEHWELGRQGKLDPAAGLRMDSRPGDFNVEK